MCRRRLLLISLVPLFLLHVLVSSVVGWIIFSDDGGASARSKKTVQQPSPTAQATTCVTRYGSAQSSQRVSSTGNPPLYRTGVAKIALGVTFASCQRTIRAVWTHVTGYNVYKLIWRSSAYANGAWQEITKKDFQTEVTITQIQPSARYSFKVRSCKDAWILFCSDWSPAVTVWTGP
jgi:hypothetical protein